MGCNNAAENKRIPFYTASYTIKWVGGKLKINDNTHHGYRPRAVFVVVVLFGFYPFHFSIIII